MKQLPPYAQLLKLRTEQQGDGLRFVMPFHEDVVGRPGPDFTTDETALHNTDLFGSLGLEVSQLIDRDFFYSSLDDSQTSLFAGRFLELVDFVEDDQDRLQAIYYAFIVSHCRI